MVASFHMGLFKQCAHLLRTLSPDEWQTNDKTSLKMKEKGKPKELELLSWKKKTNKQGDDRSLLIGERGEE